MLFGGAVASWPVRGHTQQLAPVISVMGAGSHPAYGDHMRALQEALGEMAYIENRNVAFTYRWAGGQIDRLPSLAADLVHLQVALIIAVDEQSVQVPAKAHVGIVTLTSNRRDKSSTQTRSCRSGDIAPRLHGSGPERPVRLG